MSLENLDKEKLKLILKTSQAFPAQFFERPEKTKGDLSEQRHKKKLPRPRLGHALSQHLRGFQQTKKKTKFCRLDDMAEALNLVLKTPQGVSALQKLRPGDRAELEVEIDRVFEVEGELDVRPPQKIKFTLSDLAKAGFTQRMTCFAVLEGRSRGTETYLHVHTFYPKLDDAALLRLLDAKTSSR